MDYEIIIGLIMIPIAVFLIYGRVKFLWDVVRRIPISKKQGQEKILQEFEANGRRVVFKEFLFKEHKIDLLQQYFQISLELFTEPDGEFVIVRGAPRKKYKGGVITITGTNKKYTVMHSASMRFFTRVPEDIDGILCDIFGKPRFVQSFFFRWPKMYVSGDRLVFHGSMAGHANQEKINEICFSIIFAMDSIACKIENMTRA